MGYGYTKRINEWVPLLNCKYHLRKCLQCEKRYGVSCEVEYLIGDDYRTMYFKTIKEAELFIERYKKEIDRINVKILEKNNIRQYIIPMVPKGKSNLFLDEIVNITAYEIETYSVEEAKRKAIEENPELELF